MTDRTPPSPKPPMDPAMLASMLMIIRRRTDADNERDGGLAPNQGAKMADMLMRGAGTP